MSLEDIFKSLLIGITGALCFLYGFQTRIPLPIWVLNAFNHPWVLLLVFILILVISEWNDKIGAFLILIFVAIIIDRTIFMKRVADNKEPQNIKTIRNMDFNLGRIYMENENTNIDEASGVQKLPITNEIYPVFYGLEQPQIGPAPF